MRVWVYLRSPTPFGSLGKFLGILARRLVVAKSIAQQQTLALSTINRIQFAMGPSLVFHLVFVPGSTAWDGSQEVIKRAFFRCLRLGTCLLLSLTSLTTNCSAPSVSKALWTTYVAGFGCVAFITLLAPFVAHCCSKHYLFHCQVLCCWTALIAGPLVSLSGASR